MFAEYAYFGEPRFAVQSFPAFVLLERVKHDFVEPGLARARYQLGE